MLKVTRSHAFPVHKSAPNWLAAYNKNDPFPRSSFFTSRVVYYPGSGFDGQPVAAFNNAHAGHCYVYADYLVERDEIIKRLEDPRSRFDGYHSVARCELSQRDLVPESWKQHVRADEIAEARRFVGANAAFTPFGFFEVLQRDSDRDDAYGAHRIAILFLGADGFATFDALFCQANDVPPPFCVVLQDHGFGGNYDQFGGGGLLERLARRANVLPHYLLIADNTRPWEGYVPLNGQISNSGRRLFKLK